MLSDGRILETISRQSGDDLALLLGQDRVAEVVGVELGLSAVFYYRPIYSTVYRCGFVKRKRPRWVELESQVRGPDDQVCLAYGRLLNQLTGDLRLFTFVQLGFKDVGRAMRRIGKKRPEVILLVEKESLLDDASRLARKFGISYVVTGGYPWLQASEFFVAALRKAKVLGPGRVLAVVDFDPDGWQRVNYIRKSWW